ncbi:uncharacterized protein LOC133896425 [Phragmites australis]|uniref:uncharacterized protein LOC133896425 n=1 Tax=Phragmites australis TaxID=29695 RepID=UPI002D78433D|nr:uncharacterized protein LOC133896425 [Phragmites australis]
MDGSKYRSKGYVMANAGKKLTYMLLLLLALAAAALSLVFLQKVREQRAFAGLLQERDRQLVSLRILLHKEKAFNKETKRKVEELKATTSSLRTQKIDQKNKLKGLEATVTNLKNTQKELEAALTEKDSRIRQMEEKATNLKKSQKELEAALTEKGSHIKQLEEATTNLKKTQKELEAALTEKDSRIKQMEEKVTNVKSAQKELEAVLREKDSRISQMEEKATGSNPDQMAALMEILQRKEAELEEIKTRFQDYKKTDSAGVNSKSTPVQTNNASATPDIVVIKKSTNSSSAIPAKSEEKRSANATVVENRHPKDRSLEEKPVKFTTNMEDDGLQGNINDFDEDIDIDDIYGESHSKKSGSSGKNKKFVTNNQVDSQGDELDVIGLLRNSLDQDSDRVRYNKLLEKENAKAADEVKKNNTDGTLEKIPKDSLSDDNHITPKKAVEEMAGAADVKPNINMPANSDETQQKSRKQKKKRSKSKKKMADITATNVGGEAAKQRTPDATSILK